MSSDWRSYIDRQKVLNDLQRCERDLISFHQDFTVREESRQSINEPEFFPDDAIIGY
jgi:hypothetical protein